MGKGTTNKPKSSTVDSKKLKSTTATVKKIKATLETKSKKKVYKKDKTVELDEPKEGELKPISIAEFSNIDELSTARILELINNEDASISKKNAASLAEIKETVDLCIKSLTVGRAARILVSSVMAPSALTGTLKSTLTKTRLPHSSSALRLERERFAMGCT